MEGDLRVRDDLVIPGWELWFIASRGSGPGGQHANMTSSKVTLHWSVAQSSVLTAARRAQIMRRLRSRIDRDGVLQVSAGDERSQARNRELARVRLAELVRGALRREKRRLSTKVPRGQRRRRLQDKRRRGEVKRGRQRPPDD